MQWRRQSKRHLRHWLHIWQSRTWIHDNLCYLTIKSDTGQHSQFLRCFSSTEPFGRASGDFGALRAQWCKFCISTEFHFSLYTLTTPPLWTSGVMGYLGGLRGWDGSSWAPRGVSDKKLWKGLWNIWSTWLKTSYSGERENAGSSQFLRIPRDLCHLMMRHCLAPLFKLG